MLKNVTGKEKLLESMICFLSVKLIKNNYRASWRLIFSQQLQNYIKQQ